MIDSHIATTPFVMWLSKGVEGEHPHAQKQTTSGCL